LDISDFLLDTLSYELRFPQACILWDRAGKLADTIKADWPGLTLSEGTPARLTFKHEPTGHDAVIELEKAFLIFVRPSRNLKEIHASANRFFDAVLETLDIEQLTRIGTRFVFTKEYGSVEAATRAIVDLGLVKTPVRRLFGNEPTPDLIDLGVRFQGDTTGVTIRMKSASAKVNFKPAQELALFGIEPVSKDRHVLSIDVDYYTVAKVSNTQFKASEFLQNALHLINRDISAFTGVAR
jgi:hypothetical protein